MNSDILKRTLRSHAQDLAEKGKICVAGKARRLMQILKKEEKRLKSRRLHGLALTEAEEWILDNARLLTETLGADLLRAKPVARALVRVFEELFLQDEELSEENLECIFDFLTEKKCSHSLVVSVREALLYCAASALFCRIRKGEGVRGAILSLRMLSRAPFETLITGVSPLHRILLRDPAGAYGKMEFAFCARLWALIEKRRGNQSAEEFARALLARAAKKGEYVGTELTLRGRFWGVLYQVGTLLVSTVLGAFFSVVLMLEYPTSGAVLVGFLLLGALSASGTFALFDAVFSRFLKTEKLWRIKINSFSQDTSTLVVYPAVVHSVAEVEELSERLCRAAYASYAPQKSEEHLSFALLLDLRESKRKTQGEDAVLLHAAEGAIARLNEKHGNFFYLFTRDRTRSSDGVFRGWEKKRGAILSLVAFLRGRESELRPLVGDAKRLLGTRYVLTLDADTVLTPRAVHELVGVMAHPLNSPVLSYRNGAVCVERGYGVLQPRIAPTTESAAKTLFSALHSGAGGMTAYEGAAFDRAQTLFSHGHFCGKGLFSVDVFDAVLTDAFPDERILSHDLLEGARLSCGAVLDVVLLDDTPATAREESERAHRWCRGDVQALFFSGFFVRDRYGHRKPNPMSLYYRGALWDNLRRALIPVFSAVLLLLSVFVGISSARVFILAALMPYVVPSLVDFFYLVCTRRAGGVFRRFFSPIFVGILQRFLNLVYDLSGLFFEAKNNLDAILRALWRTCVSGKKTLEWRTAAEGARARDSGVFSYVRRRFVSVLCALFLLAFSSSATVRILAVLSFLHPFFASFLSCKRRERPSLSPRDKKTLLDYAQKSAEFFVNEVGENTSHLPPDHVNFAAATTALRTSPTNIGLYLATLTVLPNFGALTLQQALSRLEKSVSCVERLPKWRGLLYNWYDLKTLAPLSDYVSLVDCGNFLACLAVVRGFLEECKEAGEDVEDLSLRVGRLLDFASLKPLYRPSHALFAIGYRADEGKFDNAHYDQYMSEARLSSFFAVARAEVPLRHWSALLRPLILRSRHLGLASFSGTAFEYFMPCLFLPIARAGMEEEALCTAAFVQKRAAVKSPFGRVFGVSESAFFATDPSGDYSYRANGIAALALSGSTAGETVISPYSSFLMLPVLGSAAVSNLRRLSKLGLFGTYGFYESAEVGRFGADVVRSVYAHHTGMILLSAANALFDGVVCRRFIKNEEFSAFLPLVSERIPAEGRVHKTDAVAFARPSYREFVGCKTVGREEVFAQVLPAKDASFIFDACGYVNVLWKQDDGLLLFRPEKGERGSLALRAVVDGALYSTLREENPQDASFKLLQSECGVTLRVSHGGNSVEFSFLLSGKDTAFSVSCEVFGRYERAAVTLSISPLFATERAYFAHSAFRALSLTAKRTAAALFVEARARGGKQYSLSITSNDPAFSVGAGDALSDLGGARAATLGEAFCTQGLGVLVNPVLLLRRDVTESCAKTQFYLGFSEGNARALFAAESMRADLKGAASAAAGFFLRAKACSAASDVADTFSATLTAAVLRAREVRLVPAFSKGHLREDLYALGISGDLPIVLCKVGEGEREDLLSRLASLHRYHAVCGFSYDLVFYSADTGYARRGLQAAEAAVLHAGSSYLISRRGGVFFVEGNLSVLDLLQDAACITVQDERVLCPAKRTRTPIAHPTATPRDLFEEDGVKSAGSGRFLKDAFLIERDVFDPKEHFSHLLASETFGAIVTHRSLGFSFETSSRFRRLSRPTDDALQDDFGEKLILRFLNGKTYDLAACAAKVLFSFGRAQYFGTAGTLQYHLTVFCHPTLLFRGVQAEFYGEGEADLSYEFSPVLGDENGVLGAFMTRFVGESTLLVTRAVSPLSRPFSAYLKLVGAEASFSRDAIGVCARIKVHGRRVLNFYLGAAESEVQFSRVNECLDTRTFEFLANEASVRALSRLPQAVAEEGGTSSFSRAQFVNRWLAYQAVTSRLLARCGFYQAGGAYGFRDQLQDSLLYLSFEPQKTLNLILRCASHQFREGDVLHWWHNLPAKDGAHRGVRTRISDDYLWLVYAACRYADKTGDTAFLSWRVPFLQGRELREKEHDLYEAFPFGEKAPLWEHLCSAAELFLARGTGKHGLSLMLSGDWNDGFDAFGEGAESVFLSQFGALCLLRLARLMKRADYRKERAEEYGIFAKKLFSSVQNTFNSRWFARAYFGDGEALGADLSLKSPCSIDVLPQAFSAFCYLEGQGERAEELSRVLSSLDAVWEHLYDKTSGVLRLFAPPFDTRGREVGYIRAYAEGVRENGGQYTHAAVWYALACRAIAPQAGAREAEFLSRAEKVMEDILPYRAALERDKARVYRLEPYALAGDVHTSPSLFGRCGWNHYTGSAAWAWRYFAESDDPRPV